MNLKERKLDAVYLVCHVLLFAYGYLYLKANPLSEIAIFSFFYLVFVMHLVKTFLKKYWASEEYN